MSNLPESVASQVQVIAPAKRTPGPWRSSAVMSSDIDFIRIISGEDGQFIAKVRYPKDMSQEEALANAKAIAATPVLVETLEMIVAELSTHPDFQRGNSKVHFAVHKARSAIACAI